VAVTLVEVLDAGWSRLATLTDVSGGSVTADYRRAVRRTLSGLVVTDGTLAPQAMSDLLSPFSGNVLRVWRGAMVGSTAEYAPLGVFTITATETAATREGTTVTLSGDDASAEVARRTLESPYVTASAECSWAIRQLLTSRWAQVPLDLTVTPHTVAPVTVDVGGDAWRTAQDLARSAGYDLAADADGWVRLRPVPVVTAGSTPAVTFGAAAVPVLEAVRPWSSDEAKTGVTVLGTSSSLSDPVYATVWDTDPASPTHYLGPLGKRVRQVSSAAVASSAQAEAMAASEVRRQSGYAADVTLRVLPNPALDVGDVVRVEVDGFPQQAMILDRITYPLGVNEAMSLSARSRVEAY
jgi:hypothetical protein